ncbi:hypothetical protein DFS33DRAFT_1321178 [Desarmillaria ectypa]|nr:hypothetical protein DFS33DRAFT_1321178 [Desarmillaria ectypa]
MALSISDAVFIAVVVEILLYGMYTCLFLGSSYILIFKREKTKVIIAMIVLNTIMWSVSTTHVMILIIKMRQIYLQGADLENGNVIHILNNESPGLYSLLALECINFFIGDGIVLWRAWILCNRSKLILWVSSILGVVACAIATASLLYTLGSPPLPSASDRPFRSIRGTIAMILTLLINVWATSMITYRTWTHHRSIRSIIGSSFVRFCKQHGILSLMIESGIFYCCTWCATVILTISTSNAIYILFCMLSQLTAIYPTLIITLVCLRLTLDMTMQSSEQITQSLHFTTGSESSNHPTQASVIAPQLEVEVATMTSGSCNNIASNRVNSHLNEDRTQSVLFGEAVESFIHVV